MDLHDYSYEEITKVSFFEYYHSNIHKPQLEKNMYNQRFAKFLYQHDFALLSWYYNPEALFYHHSYNINISILQLHALIDTDVYKRNITNKVNKHKKYEVLIYGNTDKNIYPLRYRTAFICIRNIANAKWMPINNRLMDNDLYQILSDTFIVLACVSEYSYMVRKYYEITYSGSTILGDINQEGLYYIGYNMIYIDKTMTNTYIKRKIKYYLENKPLIDALNWFAYKSLTKHNKKDIDWIIANRNIEQLKQFYRQYCIYDFIHIPIPLSVEKLFAQDDYKKHDMLIGQFMITYWDSFEITYEEFNKDNTFNKDLKTVQKLIKICICDMDDLVNDNIKKEDILKDVTKYYCIKNKIYNDYVLR